MTRSSTVRAIRSEIALRGGSVESVIHNRHIKIGWRDRTGRRHVIVTAASPSDWRAARNAAAVVRKQSRGVTP